MAVFEKIMGWMLNLMKVLGGASVMGMMFLTCVDVTGRYFGHPILGSIELVGILAVFTAAFALPYTHQVKAHIGVEMFVQMMSPRKQLIIDLFNNILSFVLFAVVTWQMTGYALTIQKSGQVTMNLQIPEHLIIFVTSFCFLVFSCQIFLEIFQMIRSLRQSQ